MHSKAQKRIELVGGAMCGLTIDINADSDEVTLESERTGMRLVYKRQRKGATGQECFHFEECFQAGEER